VYIDVNPFDYIDDSDADIYLQIEKDGYVYKIYEAVMSSKDFPFTVDGIQGDTDADGVVTMKVNGKDFIMPGDSEPYQWTAKFKPVEG
jgi:hypothetical protein